VIQCGPFHINLDFHCSPSSQQHPYPGNPQV
jgi:hypothetical protein